MSGSIEKVTENFKAILALPGLDSFSGTLESVPAVGIFGSEVRYVGINLDVEKSSAVPTWKTLDKMPALPAAGDSAALFSYKGFFYVAVGQSLWRKTPRPSTDQDLYKAATADWAQIFYPNWESLGACLPSGHFRGLAEYTTLLPDGTPETSYLVLANEDGTLSYTKDPPRPGMTFFPLTPAAGAPTPAPRYLGLSYLRASLWAYDEATPTTIYELMPDFATATYKVNSTLAASGPIAFMAAVDTGLVVARADGSLWRLLTDLRADTSQPDARPVQAWKQWLDAKGVACLGAASPGTMLNMRTLTAALRGTYIETQTAVFPYVNQLLTVATSDLVWLQKLQAAAAQYNDATNPLGEDQKKALADTQAKLAVTHEAAVSKMMSQSLAAANAAINAMKRQLGGVDASLGSQMTIIDNKLAELKALLEAKKIERKQLLLTLGIGIATLVIAIGILVASCFIPVAPLTLLTAGPMLITGIFMIIGAAIGLAEVSRDIANLERQIRSLTSQRGYLVDITAAFANLSQDYGEIAAFWFNVGAASQRVDGIIGSELLADPIMIETAIEDVQEVIKDLKDYITVLGRQGITWPPATAPQMPNKGGEETRPVPQAVLEKAAKIDEVTALIEEATRRLADDKDETGHIDTLLMAASLQT